ncbi:MAG: YraN family protein [Clostridiales bacterium]|nr:YraN family protein [Clostridiales bacterium]
MKSSYQKGLIGEELALDYLQKQGYTLLQQRYTTCHGEIDLIVEKDSRIIFVEVKYRPKGCLGEGASAITQSKKKKILLAVEQYLMEHQIHHCPLQIDVIEINQEGLWHIENAFS